jgi:hypothetical protein
MGVGLLLDALLVRTISVPAMASLVGQANWWPSRLDQPCSPPRRAAGTDVPGGMNDICTCVEQAGIVLADNDQTVGFTAVAVAAAANISALRCGG